MSENGERRRAAGDILTLHFFSADPESIMSVMAAAPSTGTSVRYTIARCALGFVAVARTEKGLAAAFIGNDAAELARQMEERFTGASAWQRDELIDRVVEAIDTTSDDRDLPLDPRGTEFQQSVWRALREIPVGATITYSDLAQRIGRPQSVRAVAAACGANPIAVIIPCHRVIGKDGNLTGYAWGIDKKQLLLDRERAKGI